MSKKYFIRPVTSTKQSQAASTASLINGVYWWIEIQYDVEFTGSNTGLSIFKTRLFGTTNYKWYDSTTGKPKESPSPDFYASKEEYTIQADGYSKYSGKKNGTGIVKNGNITNDFYSPYTSDQLESKTLHTSNNYMYVGDMNRSYTLTSRDLFGSVAWYQSPISAYCYIDFSDFEKIYYANPVGSFTESYIFCGDSLGYPIWSDTYSAYESNRELLYFEFNRPTVKKDQLYAKVTVYHEEITSFSRDDFYSLFSFYGYFKKKGSTGSYTYVSLSNASSQSGEYRCNGTNSVFNFQLNFSGSLDSEENIEGYIVVVLPDSNYRYCRFKNRLNPDSGDSNIYNSNIVLYYNDIKLQTNLGTKTTSVPVPVEVSSNGDTTTLFYSSSITSDQFLNYTIGNSHFGNDFTDEYARISVTLSNGDPVTPYFTIVDGNRVTNIINSVTEITIKVTPCFVSDYENLAFTGEGYSYILSVNIVEEPVYPDFSRYYPVNAINVELIEQIKLAFAINTWSLSLGSDKYLKHSTRLDKSLLCLQTIHNAMKEHNTNLKTLDNDNLMSSISTNKKATFITDLEKNYQGNQLYYLVNAWVYDLIEGDKPTWPPPAQTPVNSNSQ